MLPKFPAQRKLLYSGVAKVYFSSVFVSRIIINCHKRTEPIGSISFMIVERPVQNPGGNFNSEFLRSSMTLARLLPKPNGFCTYPRFDNCMENKLSGVATGPAFLS